MQVCCSYYLFKALFLIDHQPLSAGVHDVYRADLKLKRLAASLVDNNTAVFPGEPLVDEVGELGERRPVGHVVAIDHDEPRIYRAIAIYVGRPIRSLVEHVPVEVSIRGIGRGLHDRFVYARTGHLDPSDDLFREAVPINLSL